MADKKNRVNPLDAVMRHVEIAKEKLQLDSHICKKIKHAKREMIAHFPVKLDYGTVKIFTGY